jgi:hypothetical protein
MDAAQEANTKSFFEEKRCLSARFIDNSMEGITCTDVHLDSDCKS